MCPAHQLGMLSFFTSKESEYYALDVLKIENLIKKKIWYWTKLVPNDC